MNEEYMPLSNGALTDQQMDALRAELAACERTATDADRARVERERARTRASVLRRDVRLAEIVRRDAQRVAHHAARQAEAQRAAANEAADPTPYMAVRPLDARRDAPGHIVANGAAAHAARAGNAVLCVGNRLPLRTK